MQFLFKELSLPCTGERLCKVCDHVVSAVTVADLGFVKGWFQHQARKVRRKKFG